MMIATRLRSRIRLDGPLPWLLGWIVVGVAGAIWLGSTELSRLRDAFETDARIMHRLLSQRAVEHEAVLATLALLATSRADRPEQRLPAIYPRILTAARRDAGQDWSTAGLDAAEKASRSQRRATVVDTEFAQGLFWLVLAAEPASHALQIDIGAMTPAEEWPVTAEHPVGILLRHGDRAWTIQDGVVPREATRFEFHKTLAAISQPFELVATRRVGWHELPWMRMSLWIAAVGGVLAALAALRRQHTERRRAEERLRVGQVGRLNALGELAAGMAHELNQPLTAVLANAQAAARLLDDDPPDLGTARAAMARAADQARRAAGVLARLRRTVEQPDLDGRRQQVDLRAAVASALHLIEPECRQREVEPRVHADCAVVVSAEPVALEQIIHNLLRNALQALEQVPAPERTLVITIAADAAQGRLLVRDTGPGIPEPMLQRIFEPFFTTRRDGLGLGLSLCETLAASMGGSLSAAAASPRGAEFRLSLPLAPAHDKAKMQ
jgi:C4-dicarboxylate-specific signal transduction histidine kinase